MRCRTKNNTHDAAYLKIIYHGRGRTSYYQEVVRWCSVCGAVVVDVDYDGRTAPGKIEKMRFPEISRNTPLPDQRAKKRRAA